MCATGAVSAPWRADATPDEVSLRRFHPIRAMCAVGRLRSVAGPVSPHRIFEPLKKPDISEPLEQWRSAARRVESAWSAWLASEASERDWAHEAYLNALAREEQAALRLERDARSRPR